MEELLKLLKEDLSEWKTHENTSKLKIYTKPDPRYGIDLLKAEFIFKDTSPEELQFLACEPEGRKKVQPTLGEARRFDIVSENIDHFYFYEDLPAYLMTTNRDFCVKRIIMKNFKGYDYLCAGYSVEHFECLERKGMIRGNALNTSHVIESLPDGQVIMHIFSQFGLKVRKLVFCTQNCILLFFPFS